MKNDKTKEELIAFGKRIREIRIAKNISQIQLAKKSKISVSSVCSYENGRAYPHQTNINNIAIALDVTTRYLLSGKTNNNQLIDFKTVTVFDGKKAITIETMLEQLNRSINSFNAIGIGKITATMTITMKGE